MTIYLGPVAEDAARPVGGQLWRKQVLKKGPLRYTAGGQSRTLNFDDAYVSQLQQAFRDRAYDSVPFMLAGSKNEHTMDPARAAGEVVDVEATPTGLDAIVRLSSDAERIVRDNPKFGVSPRIVEGLTRADGQKWPKAMQHVLGTFDPKITGMGPWRAVNLSNEGHEVVDLSTSQNTEGDEPMGDLTEEEVTSLKQLAGIAPNLVSFMQAIDEDDDTGPGGDDEDGDQGGGDGGDLFAGAGTGGGVGLSNLYDDDPLDLGDGGGLFDDQDDSGPGGGGEPDERDVQLSAMTDELSAVRAQLAGAEWEREKAELLSAGVPPVMVSKAEVLLSAPAQAAIELSNGQHVDAAAVVREVLAAARGTVDLSAPMGHSQGDDENAEIRRLDAELDKFEL